MTLDKALIDRFNDKSTLIIFGSYPQKDHIHDKNVDALASFTKNRVLGLNATSKNKIIIITHKTDTEEIVEKHKNILVLRIFQKDHPSSFLNIINFLNQVDNVKKILIEYEFSTFGGNKMTLTFIPFLSSLKRNGFNITIELHQVLTDLKKLRGHLGYKNHDFRTAFFNSALVFFYTSIGKIAHKIIVLEYHLKEKLGEYIKKENIYFLPHGVEKIKNKPSKSTCRKILNIKKNDFVVLMFGYITWYKGSDIFIKAAKLSKNKKNIKFILAGGQSYNQKNKKHYQKWYQDTTAEVSKIKNLQYTNFVEENKMSVYFQAADLVVFPYRTFMSSSGPLSLAFSYNKPFLLSQKLSPYLKSPDIKDALLDEHFGKNLLFEPNPNDLYKKIVNLTQKKGVLNHIRSISTRIAKKRAYPRLGQKQKTIIFNHENAPKIGV